MLEIAGFLLILLIWFLLTNIKTSDNLDLGSGQFNTYYKNIVKQDLDSVYTLIYNKKEVNTKELSPVFSEIAQEKGTLLLFSNTANRTAIQSLTEQHSGINVVAMQVQGDEQDDTFNQILNFTGASIITDDFFTEDIEGEITTSFTGDAGEVSLANEGVQFKNTNPLFSKSILPSPIAVVKAYKPLWTENNLAYHTMFSVSLNLMGYLVAILIAVPLGFLIGLFPFFRGLFSRNVDALRFIPLTAVTGLFMAWFGLGVGMKIAFLAFGIIVYLLPVVVQRIDELDKVYLQTTYTMGASQWQQIKTVFLPAILSKISDDIRVLVAISWTYIIVAEMLNASDGGIGALVYTSARQSHIDKVFAILIIIILIGFIQDLLFRLLDRFLFPFKHQQNK